MFQSPRHRRSWLCAWPAIGLASWLLAVAADDSAQPERGAQSEPAADSKAKLPANDNPAAGSDEKQGDEKNDDGSEKSEGDAARTKPAVPVIAPILQFNGRWGFRFFRRNVIVGGGAGAAAAEATEEPGEGPRSVVLPDNGDMRRRLEKIKAELAEHHFADCARHLGQLLQSSEIRDFFLIHGEERRDSRSFQAEIRQMIADLPPEGRAVYLAQYEGLAKQELGLAIAQGTEPALRDVVRRFPLTSAAHEALYRLAHSLWEHGRPEAAAACLDRLRGDSAAAAPFEPALSQLLAACEERRTAGVAADVQNDGWTTYRGNPERNRAVPCRPPLLAARWTRDVATEPRTRRAIDVSGQAYRDGREVYVPLVHPLAVGELVLMRTAQGIAAFDLMTGERAWQHPSDDESDNAGFDRIVWSEPGGGAFAADAECLYLVESARPSLGAIDGTANVLAAREHYHARQGRLRWQVGGGDGGNEPALAGAIFLGPPLSWQGRLYVEAELKGAIVLVVLDARAGRLEWSQELALVERPLATDPFRRTTGAVPSISSDDIIVCPTAGGAVVAVDQTTQSLLWAYRYARRAPSTGDGSNEGDDESVEATVSQRDRWLDGTITLGRDSVILTSPESSELQCLDLHDGHLRWSQPRGEGLFLACLTAERVVVVGKTHVQAWNLSDGQSAWKAPLPSGAFTSGRGISTGDSYYLPVTSGAIVRCELATGRIDAELRSVRETPLGNLIWHRGIFISQGTDFLQAFDERESVERQVSKSLTANPQNVDALLRRGDLELADGQSDEALATFRAAHAVARSPRTRARLTSSLLEVLSREGADKPTLQSELDALAERE